MEFKMNLPLSEGDVRKLSLGDIVYLNGTMYIARDAGHMRILEYERNGKDLPADLRGSALFHCGPIMRKKGERWELVAAGPTTSSRMNPLEPPVIEKFGIRAVIGKGGMDRSTAGAMEEHGCVYLAITGGAAVLAAKGVREVKGVHWLDLGMPEALWVLEVEDFGPLIVAIDAHGNSLYERVEQEVKSRLPKIREMLSI